VRRPERGGAIISTFLLTQTTKHNILRTMNFAQLICIFFGIIGFVNVAIIVGLLLAYYFDNDDVDHEGFLG